ncbi:short-chain dehydrogenase/reductase family protein [Dictyostelium discoideum AX4]|uniref:Short-chain dehydrogenase/reductase family protein n=1 Tax=Dictyostelium discoideum TaxID=44689 RepID=C7FZY1_DICDI|nr:short-chain dehydrogenase/reductase family protein [Dictyostelium discoideum AX4]EEU04140.1 short-chain dehydrogenase/reductase family protein [Dictyostelium discoideum AX4]|eukprot:XP_002649190.1 short-chain dehydrogenase/reductase family protein [Dictyostelium discoideum AX4]
MEPTIIANQKENTDKVFLVSGTSTGLGLSIVKKLLDNKFKVSAFTRSKSTVENEIKKYYETENKIDLFKSLLVVQVDITNEESVEEGVKETIKTFGHIDVVINNAGYSQLGNVEETSDKEARAIFDVNYFAVLNIVRSTIPHLRKQRSGLILNVSSILGHRPRGKTSSYSASKYAVTGLTLSLNKELAPFNVKVLLLSPGGFRPDITNKEKFKVIENPIDEYHPLSSIDNSLKDFLKLAETTRGSHDKFANAIVKIFELYQQDKPLPTNIFFGYDAIQDSKLHFNSLLDDINQWNEISISTDL